MRRPCAVIGASLHKVGSNSDQGAAYVFTRTGSTWNQPQELTASDGGAGDGFGISVSINGNALVVGAYGHKVGSNGGEGAAYVFTLAGTTWSQQQELTASDGVVDDAIGYGAAVSSSGAVVIGAFNHEVGSNSGQGAAYFQNVTATPGTVTVDVTSQNVTAVNDNVTTTPGTATTLNVLANDSNPQGNGLQIASVGAVSPSGPTLTQNANGTLTFSSAATGTYNFNYTATGQQQEVTASDGAAEDAEGVSVAISGTTAVVGAFGRDGNQGVAYVYALSSSTWSLQAELTAADGATGDAFGYSVAIDGNTIVVGAQNHKVSGNAQGAAYVFARSGTTWSLQQELTAGDGALGDQFGESVSVSGATVVVGALEHKVGSNAEQGAVYVYTLTGTNWTQQHELTASDGKANDLFGDSVAVFGDTLVVGAYGHKEGSNAEQGAAYVFTRSGASWSQQQELTASDGAAQDYFGTSVAISGNTIVVGADDHMVGSHLAQGAAYVFSRSGPTWIQDQEITSSDGEKDDVFGESVSISGTTILVGAGEHSIDGNLNAGAAYVFAFNGSAWSQQQELTANNEAAGNEFGDSVALSGDMLMIGSPTKMVGSNSLQGAAYFQNASVSQAAVSVLVTTPAVVTATSGGGQSVPENTAFASPLIVSVTDAKGNPVSGVLVTFAAPGSGAGATFGGGNTATTNAQGQASIDPTANGRGGSYTITASVSGVAAPANFDLTNIYSTVPPPPGTNPSPNASPATVGVFNSATATWYLNGSNSSGPPTAGEFQYGAPGWIGLVGDFTGDGQTTVVMVDPSTETWYIRNSNSSGAPSITPFQFGAPGWIPVVGDWNGSGIDGIGVVDPATGNWYLRNEASAGAADAGQFTFGEAGWIPVVGNWAGNANGQDGIGMVDPSTETWYLRNTPSAGGVNYTPFSYGAPGWTPVVGAWTSSAQTGIGVYDPTGTFYLRNELSGGAPDAGKFSFGVGGWTPLAGQWQNLSDPGQNQFAAGVGPGAPALSNAVLQSTVQEALALLRADGVAPALVQELASATYTVADLPPGLLGETFVQTNTVEISADASGYGWYTDSTADDPAFAANGIAPIGSPAANHEDLLTTVLHEMGHLAGQPDVVNATTGSNLMDAILPLGTRRIDALDLVFASGVLA